jgi:hypothetical protein
MSCELDGLATMVGDANLAVGCVNCDLPDSCDVVYIFSVDALNMLVLLFHICEGRRSSWLSDVFGIHYCDGKHLDDKDNRLELRQRKLQ